MAFSACARASTSQWLQRGVVQAFQPRLEAARRIHLAACLLQGGERQKKVAGTSALASLRKRTGYSLSLCKKALGECDQDLERSKAWLKEQAQQQGWNKANKLEGRNTTQGLVGILISKASDAVVMVELNSETDFVARNKQFHLLLNSVLEVCLAQASGEDPVSVTHLDKVQLASVGTGDGKTLADLVALYIGQVGENLILRRGVVYKTNCPEAKLSFLTHPSPSVQNAGGIAYGRFGTVVSYAREKDYGVPPEEGQTVDSLARQLCQHVIGMNPRSLGSMEEPKEEEESAAAATIDPEPKGEGEQEDEDWSHIEDKLATSSSSELLHQAFLTNPDVTVRDVLLDSGMRITSFVRFEVGETADDN